jgi:hypothetical protein
MTIPAQAVPRVGNRGGGVSKSVIAAVVCVGFAGVAAISQSGTDTAIRPAVITVTGWDESGEVVEQHYDADPMSVYDIWATGEGDTNFDGVVDMADLNLVLANFGKGYL